MGIATEFTAKSRQNAEVIGRLAAPRKENLANLPFFESVFFDFCDFLSVAFHKKTRKKSAKETIIDFDIVILPQKQSSVNVQNHRT